MVYKRRTKGLSLYYVITEGGGVVCQRVPPTWAMSFGRRRLGEAIWAMPFGRRATWATGHLGDRSFGRWAVWATSHLGDAVWATGHFADTTISAWRILCYPFFQGTIEVKFVNI